MIELFIDWLSIHYVQCGFMNYRVVLLCPRKVLRPVNAMDFAQNIYWRNNSLETILAKQVPNFHVITAPFGPLDQHSDPPGLSTHLVPLGHTMLKQSSIYTGSFTLFASRRQLAPSLTLSMQISSKLHLKHMKPPQRNLLHCCACCNTFMKCVTMNYTNDSDQQ